MTKTSNVVETPIIHGIKERYDGTLTALSQISHGGNVSGNTMQLHRQKLVWNGQLVDLPFISGNAFRGILRDEAMFFMCKILELQDLSVEALHTLFSGGALAKRKAGDNTKGVNLASQRDLINYVPALSLFGAAVGNSMLSSPLKVSHIYPICIETIDTGLVPEKYADHPQAGMSFYNLCDTISFSRMDDAKNPIHQRLLASGERQQINMGLLDAAVRTANDEVKSDKEQSQQMRYSVQCFAVGTVFCHSFELIQVTEMQRNAFHATLEAWAFNAYIGGKSAQGLGKVLPQYEKMQPVGFTSYPNEEGKLALHSDSRSSTVQQYVDYMVANRDKVVSILNGI